MIKECCKKANLKIINSHYFYASLVPLRILTKLLNRDNKVNERKYSENHFITKTIKNILTFDYNICKKMNKLSFGLSLFIVIEKK